MTDGGNWESRALAAEAELRRVKLALRDVVIEYGNTAQSLFGYVSARKAANHFASLHASIKAVRND